MNKRKKHDPPATQNPPQGSASSAPQEAPEVLPEQAPEIKSSPRQREEKIISAHFSGPLPPPAALESYERIIPGAADRIMKMAEANNAFMIDMDKEVVRSQFMERRLGQCFGFVLGAFGLGGSFWLASIGHDGVAIVLGGATLLGLVSTFVYGRAKSKSSENSKPS